MPRGGRRKGTPGKGYSNRTDLISAPDMKQNTAATGGMRPENPPASPFMAVRSPEDSPMLTEPSQRNWEPVTAGSDFGAGADSSALNLPDYKQMNQRDLAMMKDMMPRLIAASQMANAPETFKQFVAYMRRTI